MTVTWLGGLPKRLADVKRAEARTISRFRNAGVGRSHAEKMTVASVRHVSVQKAPEGPLQPRINTNRRADSTTVTSSEPAQPSRFEKNTNTYLSPPISLLTFDLGLRLCCRSFVNERPT